MPLGSDLTKRSFLLLTGRELGADEAAAKAGLLGSKHELLAHLVLIAGAFDHEPDLRQLLRGGGAEQS